MHEARRTLLGLPLDATLTADSVVDRLVSDRPLLTYLNPFAWQVAKQRPGYASDLIRMDIVSCDGIAVQRAANRILACKPAIISLDYSGIAPQYLEAFRKYGRSMVLVGGAGPVSKQACSRILTDFPGIRILEAFSGFDGDPDMAAKFIVQERPDVVLAGLGMGRQESFLLNLRDQGWQGSGICVGAFFDRLARPGIDYPQWSKRWNVRFLGNLSRRPVYYLKRYGVDYWPFLKQYGAHILGRKDRSP